MFKNKKEETNLTKLLEYKRRFKAFAEQENNLQKKLDLLPTSKQRTMVENKLKLHRASFKELEKNLIEAEDKMINLDRGLYKGIAINVRDKSYTRFPLYLKFSNLNNHVSHTGTTRVGKTKNLILDSRQLINKKNKNDEHEWDVFIIDPKGGENQEILTETIQSSLLAKRAGHFKYLSPAFPKESELINLLYGMEDDEAANMIKTFAEAVGGDDGFFTAVVYENTLSVLKALTFIEAATDPSGEYTKELERQEVEKYHLLKNYKDIKAKLFVDRWNQTTHPNELLVTSEEENSTDEFISIAPSITFYQNRSMVTFKILNNYVTYKSIENLKISITELITIPPIEEIGAQRYSEILLLREEALSSLEKVLATDEMNFSKIAKTHSVLLSQLVYGDIGKVFNGIGINPLANKFLLKDSGLICVMQPFPMKYKTVANISVMAILKMVESMMGLIGSSGRSNKRRLAIMIDEAGSVMYKDIIELFNKAGGLGVSIFTYTQSYVDYSLAIGKDAGDVAMDNLNTPIVMRMNNEESCKRAAESLGSVRKQKSMYMTSDNGGRFSVAAEDEAIATAENISSLPIAMGYMRHDKETYLVDFPYVKGLDNYPIRMPVLLSESKRRYIAKYELEILNSKKIMIEEIKNIDEDIE